MDPEGRFVDAFGKALDKDEVYEKVDRFVGMWKDGGNELIEKKGGLKREIEGDESRRVEEEK